MLKKALKSSTASRATVLEGNVFQSVHGICLKQSALPSGEHSRG